MHDDFRSRPAHESGQDNALDASSLARNTLLGIAARPSAIIHTRSTECTRNLQTRTSSSTIATAIKVKPTQVYESENLRALTREGICAGVAPACV